MSIVTFLHWSFLFLLPSKLSKLLGKKIFHAELVLVVNEVRDVHGGAARADPVGADRAGIPSSEPGLHLLLFTNRLRAALDVGGHIARDVEHRHVVALCRFISTYFNDDNTILLYTISLNSLYIHSTAHYTSSKLI